MMRKLLGLAVGAAMMAAGPVQAAEWWLVTATGRGDLYFVDVESLRHDGDQRKFWYQSVNKIPMQNVQNLKSARTFVNINCELRTYQRLSIVSYDDNNTVIHSETFSFSAEKPVPPDTVMDDLRLFACSDPSTWSDELGASPVPLPPLDFAAIVNSNKGAAK